MVGTPGNPAVDRWGREIVPANYTPAANPNEVSFGFANIAPPSTVYIQRDDVLVLQGNTTMAGGDTLTLTARLLLAPQPNQPTGRIVLIQARLALPNPGVNASTVVSLAEGYLLSLAITTANATSFGQTYASAFIGQGSVAGAAPLPSLMLVADYPTTIIPVGWPAVPIRQTANGQGFISPVAIGNPAAGADWIFTAQTGLRTRVHSARFQLATSATVATRVPLLQIRDASNNIYAQINPSADVTASGIINFTFGIGLGYNVDNTAGGGASAQANAPLPLIDLIGGWKLQTGTLNLIGTDQYQLIFLTIETWVQ